MKLSAGRSSVTARPNASPRRASPPSRALSIWKRQHDPPYLEPRARCSDDGKAGTSERASVRRRLCTGLSMSTAAQPRTYVVAMTIYHGGKHEATLTECIESVLTALREAKPRMGKIMATDGSDLPAYGNGQHLVKLTGG